MPDQSIELLDLVSAALGPDGPSLTSNLDALSRALAAAVPSFLGFSVYAADYAFSWGPHPVQAFRELSPAASSLTWQVVHTGEVVVTLVLLARVPGAWVDLAADLTWLTGAAPERLVLDGELTSPFPVEQSTPSESSIINQALGVLLASGHPPQGAAAELELLAQQAGTDRATAARTLLERLEGPDGG